MPATYRTPGVYVEEISTLPQSVAEVSTAIPAFIGHTQSSVNTVARVTSLLEYEQRFGQPKQVSSIVVTIAADAGVSITTFAPTPHCLHAAVSMYFKNGGGACYIVSVGGYDTALSRALFEAGLTSLEKEDEPTLIVMPEATSLSATDHLALCQTALQRCKSMGDRFAILDVKATADDTAVAAFRNGIGTEALDFGAAYYPDVKTTLSYTYEDSQVEIVDQRATPLALPAPPPGSPAVKRTLDLYKSTAFYQPIKDLLAEKRITLPPSAAVAGVYASVDRDRGVWKAPANVGLSSVIAPVAKITNAQQDGMNVDPDGGKSINAIRAFAGKGTLVWGARTLAGNSNEWRYVPVRRLFLMIEESARKATSFTVFEPNDMTTWLKAKGMIESYLYGLWERGALAGATPEAAYFVDVGLGKTMTAQDILEGRMIVKIGVAAVRPAEFIILQFSHKLQEA